MEDSLLPPLNAILREVVSIRYMYSLSSDSYWLDPSMVRTFKLHFLNKRQNQENNRAEVGALSELRGAVLHAVV